MSAGQKHKREEAGEQAVRLPKKARTEDGKAETNGDSPVKKEKEKKEKEKKEKKDKGSKKDKKKKDKKAKEAQDEETKANGLGLMEISTEDNLVPAADVDEGVQPAATKTKKDKKDKKKDKKKKAAEAEETESTTEGSPLLDAATEEKSEHSKESSSVPATSAEEQDNSTTAKPKKEKKEKKVKNKHKKDAAAETSQNGTAKASREDGVMIGSGNKPYSYAQTASLSAIPESEIKKFLSEKEITITESVDSASQPTVRPILQFSHLPASTLLSKKPFASFKAPTPIQSASWPFALSGRDVVGVAETGSGKTMAFSLPCIESLSSIPKTKNSKKDRVTYARAVIVSPTRELAMQTHVAISGLAALVGLSAVCIYGGASKDDQRALLRQNTGADIIVATPGRLKDFLNEGSISLSEVTFAVLDEADRMLDKGFEDDIKLILGSCKPRESRQTLMFTATWPTSVRTLAESFMVNPVKITIGGRAKGGDEDGNGGGNGALELQANSRITQKVEVVDPRGKEFRLFEILKEAQKGKNRDDRILVFCLYKKEATRVEQFLERKGIRVVSIHGDLRQEQRTRSLEAFKSGTTSVLVATDVAARGLDIPEVKLVVNLTFPLTIEDYVHRIGRTGRAGKEGNAITLFTEHDKAHSGSLINILKAANQPVPDELMKFGTTVKKKAHDAYGAFYKNVDMTVKAKKIVFD